jgi:membrane-bound lytic murein transglycosylase MltF
MILTTATARRFASAWTLLLILTAACNASPRPASTSQAPAASVQAGAPQEAAAEGESAGGAEDDGAVQGIPLKVVDQKWTGDLDGMIERRLIRVLTVYSKTTFFVDKGTQLGTVPEAFKLFEDDLNKRLKNKNVIVHVVIVPVAADELIPALLAGRGDIVSAGKLATAWRREQVDFTNATRKGISSIIVTGPGVAPLNTLEDLAGKEVYVRASDVSAKNVQEFNARLTAAGKPPVRIKPAPEVLADEDLLEMVNAGLVPMTVVDDYIAEFWKQIFPNLVLNTAFAVRTDGETAMMIRKGSPKLTAELNAFLARYPEGSLQRNVLFQKYLKNVKFAKSATSGPDRERFRQTIAFLRKYSDKYKLDYLLMAAQGYQESRLDQDAKSAVGAVGVMQLMPETGKEQKVGDIKNIEPNVHAGVKYMRFIRKSFFDDQPMDALNKALFTFAAYNAGPGRVRALRREAEQRGLDPNVWFGSVERIASERIGRETVTYVSNIYKYYVAYRLLTSEAARRKAATAQR